MGRAERYSQSGPDLLFPSMSGWSEWVLTTQIGWWSAKDTLGWKNSVCTFFGRGEGVRKSLRCSYQVLFQSLTFHFHGKMFYEVCNWTEREGNFESIAKAAGVRRVAGAILGTRVEGSKEVKCGTHFTL